MTGWSTRCSGSCASVQSATISVLDLPTAFWHELVLAFESEGLALPPSVRLVIIGGEKALTERVAQWHAHTAQTARPRA